jgi:hypothetical protein
MHCMILAIYRVMRTGKGVYSKTVIMWSSKAVISYNVISYLEVLQRTEI